MGPVLVSMLVARDLERSLLKNGMRDPLDAPLSWEPHNNSGDVVVVVRSTARKIDQSLRSRVDGCAGGTPRLLIQTYETLSDDARATLEAEARSNSKHEIS